MAILYFQLTSIARGVGGAAVADWLTLEELAGYLKRGKSTLYKMAQLGEIPAKKIGRSWRFDRDEIDAWLRRQTVPSGVGKRKRTSRRSSKRGAK